MIDLDAWERIARAAFYPKPGLEGFDAEVAFNHAFRPADILELCAEVRRLRAELNSFVTACGELNQSNVELLGACRTAVMALAYASKDNPACRPAYEAVSAAIDAARKEKA